MSRWQRNVAQSLLSRRIHSPSQRDYGPTPSDIRPLVVSDAEDTRSRGLRPNRKPWPEASRARLREAYKLRKSQGNLHPLEKWRLNNPLAHDLLAETAIRVRKQESQEKLLQLLGGCIPRTLNVWIPTGTSEDDPMPRYRLTLFGITFILRPDIGRDWGEPRTVFISLSISPDAPHPHPAERPTMRKPRPSRLHGVGFRVFGTHPVTKAPFDEWITTSNSILRRILAIADGVEDQDALRELCSDNLKKNLARERWGR